jgi:hypothetical protein
MTGLIELGNPTRQIKLLLSSQDRDNTFTKFKSYLNIFIKAGGNQKEVARFVKRRLDALIDDRETLTENASNDFGMKIVDSLVGHTQSM